MTSLSEEEQARLKKLATARRRVADNAATGDRLDKKLASAIRPLTAAVYERDRLSAQEFGLGGLRFGQDAVTAAVGVAIESGQRGARRIDKAGLTIPRRPPAEPVSNRPSASRVDRTARGVRSMSAKTMTRDILRHPCSTSRCPD